MKKVLIMTAVAALAVVGCAKVEKTSGVEVSNGSQIVFTNPFVSPATKAALTGEAGTDYNFGVDKSSMTESNTEKFKVWCINSASALTNVAYSSSAYTMFFEDETCTYDSAKDGWVPANTYYWPKGNNSYLSFHAFSPADVTGTLTHDWEKGFKLENFVQGGVGSMVDVLYSDYAFDKQGTAYSNVNKDDDDDTGDRPIYNGVDLNFRHALAKIDFKIKTLADYSATTTIKLKSIEVGNVLSRGTFDECRNTTTDKFDNLFSTTEQAGSWSSVDTKYAANLSYVSHADFASSQEVSYNSGTAQDVTGKALLMLVPQTLDHSDAEGVFTNDVFVTVKWYMKTGGTTLECEAQKKLKGLVPTSADPNKVDAVDNSGTLNNWYAGRHYVYTISIGLDEIIFDPRVTNWVEVGVDGPTI